MEIANINSDSNKFSFQVNADKDKKQKNVHFQDTKSEKNTPTKSVPISLKFQQKIKIKSSEQFSTQNAIGRRSGLEDKNVSKFKFEGKPVTEMDRNRAKEMISENGYFGAKKTGHRIASSAISIAGDDVEKLKMAREATIQGFKEAEAAFGGKLFQISYDTLDVALKEIDDKIHELNGFVIDVEA